MFCKRGSFLLGSVCPLGVRKEFREKMREKMFAKVLCAGLVVFGMSVAANAAEFDYEWAGGEPPTLRIGDTADG